SAPSRAPAPSAPPVYPSAPASALADSPPSHWTTTAPATAHRGGAEGAEVFGFCKESFLRVLRGSAVRFGFASSFFLLLRRAGVLQSVLVVPDLVRPVLAVERPVLVSGSRHGRPEQGLRIELTANVEIRLQHFLLALRRLEADDFLVAVEHFDQVRHVRQSTLDELAGDLRHQRLLLADQVEKVDTQRAFGQFGIALHARRLLIEPPDVPDHRFDPFILF